MWFVYKMLLITFLVRNPPVSDDIHTHVSVHRPNNYAKSAGLVPYSMPTSAGSVSL
jgi:hypothetical protein